jgi:hypothetical protein
MHWGWENERVASKRQRELAYKMIDAGATAVVGGHPHVTQETEIYRGKPIIYSLGNFLIDSLDNEPQTRGWIARLEIDRQGVIAFDTKPVRLNQRGIPAFMPAQSSLAGIADWRYPPSALPHLLHGSGRGLPLCQRNPQLQRSKWRGNAGQYPALGFFVRAEARPVNQITDLTRLLTAHAGPAGTVAAGTWHGDVLAQCRL